MLVLQILAILAIVGAFLPLWDSDHWIVRGQNNFKFPYLILSIALLLMWVVVGVDTIVDHAVVAGLCGAVIHCAWVMLPFTAMYPTEMPTVPSSRPSLRLLVYNVLQTNREYGKLIDLVDRVEPESILLLETGLAWDAAMEPLRGIYPYEVKEIREDTYGIIYLSKYEIKEGGINTWVTPEVPSVEVLHMIDRRPFRLVGLHPKPPVPGEKLYSTTKDKEIARAGHYLSQLKEDESRIMLGDLNDVAWSRAAKHFKQMTGMVDPRVGRGTYSTFPTQYWIRFPLDHVFCSRDLGVVDFRRMPHIGSDHFPVLIEVARLPES